MIPVIIEIHTDFLCPFLTPDMTLTRPNQMLRDDDETMIYLARWNNKQTKTLTQTLRIQLLQPLHLLTDTTVATATTLVDLLPTTATTATTTTTATTATCTTATTASTTAITLTMALGFQDISWGHT